MAIPAVTFNYAAWVAAFPQFKGINSSDAQMYFDGASTICANDTCSPAWSTQVAMGGSQVPLLQRLLWLLTCHLAFLGAFRDASGNPSSTGVAPPPPLVGRVSSAAEGSVNISTELDTSGYPVPGFFQQTPWGFNTGKRQINSGKHFMCLTQRASSTAFTPVGELAFFRQGEVQWTSRSWSAKSAT